ncbi:MAG TPA: STAS/SEC14 domain-containing protein [Acidiferrobacteraceae bacterium]|nr:STAS/SEC14 domain-containing protein [Acidiferrobacteraceae bacterium]
MITTQEDKNLIGIKVFGELTIADFREFEDAVTDELEHYQKIDLLVDLSEMTGFTLDAALEDIQFNRQHAHDFKRIAIVTDSQWLTWLSWLSGTFTQAEVQTFPDIASANNWLAG